MARIKSQTYFQIMKELKVGYDALSLKMQEGDITAEERARWWFFRYLERFALLVPHQDVDEALRFLTIPDKVVWKGHTGHQAYLGCREILEQFTNSFYVEKYDNFFRKHLDTQYQQTPVATKIGFFRRFF
jgi:hypothetical protein